MLGTCTRIRYRHIVCIMRTAEQTWGLHSSFILPLAHAWAEYLAYSAKTTVPRATNEYISDDITALGPAGRPGKGDRRAQHSLYVARLGFAMR